MERSHQNYYTMETHNERYSKTMIPLFGPIGPELLIIVLVLVLLFGANQIPQLANAVGKAMGSFKKGRQEAEKEVEEIQEEVEDVSEDVSEEVSQETTNSN